MRHRLALAGCGFALCAALACLGTTGPDGPSRAPASVGSLADPLRGDPTAVAAGRKLFERHCAHCHEPAPGAARRAPTLGAAAMDAVPAGALFWFVTNGNLRAGMPAWSRLPRAQRWQLVAYLRSSHSGERERAPRALSLLPSEGVDVSSSAVRRPESGRGDQRKIRSGRTSPAPIARPRAARTKK